MAYTPATEALIKTLQSLPGIGVRSAQRMALQLLERDRESAQALSQALSNALEHVQKCSVCRTLTESDVCEICSNDERDQSNICIVASDVDKAGIEMSGHYQGRFFVLHGLLSPIDGMGPAELGVSELITQLEKGGINEVIWALDDQVEAQATGYYLNEQIKSFNVLRTRIPFTQMKSGTLDKTDSHIIGKAFNDKQAIGSEYD